MIDKSFSQTCIHIGLPKTATTTLQFSLFACHSQIQYLGKPYYSETFGYEKSKACADLVDAIWRKDSFQYSPETARQLYRLGVEPRGSADKLLLLSEEGLTYAGAADRYLIAQRLHHVFGSCKILITIREQQACLKSGYSWLYSRCLVDMTFDQWISYCLKYSPYRQNPDDFPMRQFLYRDVVRNYEKLFGKENVLVLPYEELANTPARFAEKLSLFLGIDQSETAQLLSREQHNVSPSYIGIKYQRSIKKTRQLISRLKRDHSFVPSESLETGPVHDFVMRWLNRLPKMKVSVSSETTLKIHEYYSHGNRELLESHNLNLDEYGYSL